MHLLEVLARLDDLGESVVTELARATGCREYLGRHGWCEYQKAGGEFCEQHAAERDSWLERTAKR